jgi:uncharacterized protein YndB with AHSA1/START domain
MADITLEVSIKAPAHDVFEAIATADGVKHWWTTDAKALPTRDSVSEFGFGNRAVVMRMRVDAIDPDRRLRWECLDQPEDWTGTVLEFGLSQDGGATRVIFSQTNWRGSVDGTKYTGRWRYFLDSLRSYLETGQGTPEQ